MTVEKIEKAMKKTRKAERAVPVHADPLDELRRLVRQHAAIVRSAVSVHNQRTDKKNRETGAVIPCRLPADARAALEVAENGLKAQATEVESLMTAQLKQVPIYKTFLSKVYGCGPVVAAYLCAEIDIRDRPNGKALKPSSLRLYCGLAVIDGRLVRRERGVVAKYNANMRTRIFQMMMSMFKNAARKTKDRPNGSTSKYLDVWANTKHRVLSSERVHDGKLVAGSGKVVSAKGHAHSMGWHKAADVFLEDLYIVWRAMEGLPVWPSYYAAKLGYEHGGRICVNAPKLISVEEALDMVGNVGGQPARVPVAIDAPELDDEDAAAIAAE